MPVSTSNEYLVLVLLLLTIAGASKIRQTLGGALVKNKIADIFLKGILVLLFEILVIVSPSHYAFSLTPSDEVGIMIMLLFVVYPLLSILIGILTYKLKINAWVNAVITTIVFWGLFSVYYNDSAYAYVPFYLMLFFIGLILTKKLSKKPDSTLS